MATSEKLRRAMIAILAIVLACLAARAAVSASLASSRPQLAIAVDPANVLVIGRTLEKKLADGRGKRPLTDNDRRLLQDALRGNALARQVLRVMALDRDIVRDRDSARALMQLSDRISRRDLMTQIWL